MEKEKSNLKLAVTSDRTKAKKVAANLAEPANINEIIGVTSQNAAMNSAFKLNDKRNTKKNYNRELVVKADAVTAITKATHLGLPEQVMLTYAIDKFNQESNHDNNKQVTFTLKDYMRDRGLKDPKSARNNIKKCLDALTNTTYSYSGGNSKSPYNQSFGAHHILDYDYKRGKVTIDFSDFFFNLLVHGSMPMPNYKIMFRLDPLKDATTIYILRALEKNKRINKPKSTNKSKKNSKAQTTAPERGDRIKISTLLHDVASLSSYDEIKEGTDRHTYGRLILPVFKAVERLADPTDPYRAINRYSFMDADNKPIDYDNIDYETFSNAYLVIEEWHRYPEDKLKQWSERQKAIRSKEKNKQKSKEK